MIRLLRQAEKVIQPHQEDIEVVNLGAEDDVKEVRIWASLEESVKARLIDILRKFINIFSWSYQDMSGLDVDIVVHRLPLKDKCPSVKQMLRRTHPDMSKKIKDEVQKQFDAGFLEVTSYPLWVANIVLNPKKDGKV